MDIDRLEQQAAQRVPGQAVVTRGYEHHLGRELVERRREGVPQLLEVLGTVGAGGQRNVARGVAAGPGAALAGVTSAGVPRVLVERDARDGLDLVEDVLRSVPALKSTDL